ncbi:DMT family transporter [Brevirhabdus sp.]|uniref:DMT family transporter n=1 Tax=Brevirhabdus sp. TaxID=2004514 RepID=UPI0040597A96
MSAEPAETPVPLLRVGLWMVGAIASFSMMAVAGRAVSFELDTFELMTWRSLVGLVLVLGVSSVAGTRGQIRCRRLGLHLLRNLFHFAGQNLWFWAIAVIPLAQVFSFEFSTPLWVALLAPLVLGERLTRRKLVAAALGFVGILIVARPDVDGIAPGQMAAALAAVGFAGSALATKVLSRSESITTILFWLTVMQAIFGLICAGIDGDVTLPSATTFPWLVVIGMAGLAAHFCLTTALTLAPATVVMPMDFARLPVIAVVGALVYSEPLDPVIFLGAGFIVLANVLNLRRDRPGLSRPVA